MHASVERWLGVLATGVLRDRADEDAVLAATRIVGEEALGGLREWFAARTPQERQTTQCAVIEACIAMVHADRVVTDAERAQLRALIDASRLDEAHVARMRKGIDHAPHSLDAVVARHATRRVERPVPEHRAVGDDNADHLWQRRNRSSRRDRDWTLDGPAAGTAASVCNSKYPVTPI